MLMSTSDIREDINPTTNIITKKISCFEYLSLPSMEIQSEKIAWVKISSQ